MKNALIALLALIIFSTQGFSQSWMMDFEKAKKVSAETGNPILLNFSGSDWCVPCMRLKKEYFEDEKFKKFAEDKLVLINADFPRKKSNRPPADIMNNNEELAEKYNPNGAFPMTLLLNSEGKILKSWEGIPPGGLENFLSELNLNCSKSSGLNLYRKDLILMGSRFIFSVAATSEEEGMEAVDEAISEVRRIEKEISSWNKKSETTKINSAAGIEPVKVSDELFSLIERCKNISSLTSGAFDISFGSIDTNIWHFTKNTRTLPSPEVARQAVRLVNSENIILNKEEQTVFLKEKGMKIGFGAIGKGYAAERAKKVLLEKGIKSGVVNAGGDLTVWGTQPDGTPWTIGIADPEKKEVPFSKLEISDIAVVTSGNYEKFVLKDGNKYSHIIDPKTGFPVTGIQSVTIFGRNAELADALATAVFVMGVESGLDLIEQIPDFEVLILDETNKIITSSNLHLVK